MAKTKDDQHDQSDELIGRVTDGLIRRERRRRPSKSRFWRYALALLFLVVLAVIVVWMNPELSNGFFKPRLDN